MRRWQWMALATMILGGSAGAYWYFTPKPATVLPPFVNDVPRVVDRGNGAAEESDVIEPLIVDRGKVSEAPVAAPVDVGPMPRVLLEPGMEQPPRPDAGRVPRMPYADEEEILGLGRDPIKKILEKPEAASKIFELFAKASAAEESENKLVRPPVDALQDIHTDKTNRDYMEMPLVTPAADPLRGIPRPDYHHNQCPYHGGCPAYPNRPVPRD